MASEKDEIEEGETHVDKHNVQQETIIDLRKALTEWTIGLLFVCFGAGRFGAPICAVTALPLLLWPPKSRGQRIAQWIFWPLMADGFVGAFAVHSAYPFMVWVYVAITVAGAVLLWTRSTILERALTKFSD